MEEIQNNPDASLPTAGPPLAELRSPVTPDGGAGGLLATTCEFDHEMLRAIGRTGSTKYREFSALKQRFMYFKCPGCIQEFDSSIDSMVELYDEVEPQPQARTDLGVSSTSGLGNSSDDSSRHGTDTQSYRAHSGAAANRSMDVDNDSNRSSTRHTVPRARHRRCDHARWCKALQALGTLVYRFGISGLIAKCGSLSYGFVSSPMFIGLVCFACTVEVFVSVVTWMPIPPYAVRIFIWHFVSAAIVLFVAYRTMMAAYILFRYGGVITIYNEAAYKTRHDYLICDDTHETGFEVLTKPQLDREDIPLVRPGGIDVDDDDLDKAHQEIMVTKFGKSRRHAWGSRVKKAQLEKLLRVQYPYEKFAHVMMRGGDVEKDSLTAQLIAQVQRTMKDQGFCDGTISANVKSIVAELLSPSVDDMVARKQGRGIAADIKRDYADRQGRGQTTGNIKEDIPIVDFATLVRKGVPGPLKARLN